MNIKTIRESGTQNDLKTMKSFVQDLNNFKLSKEMNAQVEKLNDILQSISIIALAERSSILSRHNRNFPNLFENVTSQATSSRFFSLNNTDSQRNMIFHKKTTPPIVLEKRDGQFLQSLKKTESRFHCQVRNQGSRAIIPCYQGYYDTFN
eukprot:TRINITY_DN5705_c0_g2_i1.p1 TRINITY_DN5705_c0_g2~~TRINITY_DN5705_c0_g2_i1.p1  ORF type:complete len:161 (-),score=15.91 TRINITY_DN5705_c0_g2_i1:3-452(-)